MRLFQKFFGSPSDSRLRERASNLVPASSLAAIAMLSPLARTYPALVHVDTDRWDFLVQIAGVHVALLALAGRRDPDALHQIIRSDLDKIGGRAAEFLADCAAFGNEALQDPSRFDDPQEELGNAIGIWILWNLYGRAPMFDEAAPAKTIGGMLFSTFGTWWDDPDEAGK